MGGKDLLCPMSICRKNITSDVSKFINTGSDGEYKNDFPPSHTRKINIQPGSFPNCGEEAEEKPCAQGWQSPHPAPPTFTPPQDQAKSVKRNYNK